MKKRFLLIATAIMLVVFSLAIYAAPTNNPKIDWLIEKGYVYGDERGYGLERTISRAEITAMLIRTMPDGENYSNMLKATKTKFKDVPVNQWYTGYINYAVQKNIISGYEDGTFKPQANITNAELITMFVRLKNANIQAQSGEYWYTPFVQEAVSGGLLEGITISNYKALATRETSFTVFYNAIAGSQANISQNYKGIVVKNPATGSSNGTVVIKITEAPSGLNSSYKRANEVTVDMSKVSGTYDLDKILGCSVNFTMDGKGNVSSVSVVSNGKLETGPAKFTSNSVYINGKTYNLNSEFSPSIQYDALAKMYYNGSEISYTSFISNYSGRQGAYSSDGVTVEYARVRIVNDKAVFVEAFDFSDIAPVESVKGDKIYYYDDARRGDLSYVTLKNIYRVSTDGLLKISVSDVKENSVIHIYNNDCALVLDPNMKSDTYKGISNNRDAYFLKIGSGDVQIRESDRKTPVLSFDGKSYTSIRIRYTEEDLKPFENTTINYLVDLTGSIQLIKGNSVRNATLMMINDRNYYGFKVVTSDDKESSVNTGRNTIFYIGRSNKNVTISDFSVGDLIYVDQRYKDDASTVIRVASASEQNSGSMELLDSGNERYYTPFDTRYNQFAVARTANQSSLGKTSYKYDSQTLFFIADKGSNQSYFGQKTYYRGTTPEKLNQRLAQGSKVFVLTDRDLYEMNINTNNRNYDRAAVVIVTAPVDSNQTSNSANFVVSQAFSRGDGRIYLTDINYYRPGVYGTPYDVASNAYFDSYAYREGDKVTVNFDRYGAVTSVKYSGYYGDSNGNYPGYSNTIRGTVVRASQYDGAVTITDAVGRTTVLYPSGNLGVNFSLNREYIFYLDASGRYISAQYVK